MMQIIINLSLHFYLVQVTIKLFVVFFLSFFLEVEQHSL